MPARTGVQDLIVSMSLESEALDRYTLSRDSADLTDYWRFVRARRLATSRLRSLVRELNGVPAERMEGLLAAVAAWEAASAQAIAAARSRVDGARPPPDLASRFRRTLVTATVAQRALSDDNERARAQIDFAEQLDWVYTLALAVLALAASAFIGWLVRLVHGLASVAEQRRMEAEVLLEDRARLIRGVTHDLKNPLGAADGNAQLLEMGVGGGLTEGQREAVQRIRRGIRGALGIISDLLELSRAHAGKLELEKAPTAVKELLEEIAEDYRPHAETQGVTLEPRVPADLERVPTDGRRVRQIVGNLLSNAIKYSPEGGRIMLTVERTGGEAPGRARWLAISVRDTGPGIPPQEAERIFEEFHRVEPLSGRAAGAGLGLSISRRIARLLGGDLTVSSGPGQGATFTLWLPLEDGMRRFRAA